MASKELQNAINGYENYIERHGIDEELINAYVLVAGKALVVEKDVEFGLSVSEKSKKLINKFLLKQADGDIWTLERYQQDRETTPYNLVDQYYNLLKYEAEYRFESFMLYMER